MLLSLSIKYLLDITISLRQKIQANQIVLEGILEQTCTQILQQFVFVGCNDKADGDNGKSLSLEGMLEKLSLLGQELELRNIIKIMPTDYIEVLADVEKNLHLICGDRFGNLFQDRT